jgi:hypothetical protein
MNLNLKNVKTRQVMLENIKERKQNRMKLRGYVADISDGEKWGKVGKGDGFIFPLFRSPRPSVGKPDTFPAGNREDYSYCSWNIDGLHMIVRSCKKMNTPPFSFLRKQVLLGTWQPYAARRQTKDQKESTESVLCSTLFAVFWYYDVLMAKPVYTIF